MSRVRDRLTASADHSPIPKIPNLALSAAVAAAECG